METIDAIKASGLDYTIINTGFFYEFWWTPMSGFDLQNGKVSWLGDGNTKVSVILMDDLAKFIPEILLDPYSKNNTIRVHGQSISGNEAVQIFEEISGKKLQVTYPLR
jgi:uncharacterized protein YbjT (DUF2867 family)